MSKKIADMEYVQRPTRALKLDLYLPDSPSPSSPVVVWIHGGGWRAGNKSACPIEYMTASGFATASIEYRLSGEAIFPAAIEDCHAAVCWLRSHADQYDLDGGRIGVAGMSAGGHLAALLGTSGRLVNWSGFSGPADCGQVQAVVNNCGPTLLTRYANPDLQKRFALLTEVVCAFLGGPVQDRLALAREASPLAYVHGLCPPFLTLHGCLDNVVPIEEADILHAALTATGVESTLVRAPATGHGVYDANRWIPPMVLQFFQRAMSVPKAG